MLDLVGFLQSCIIIMVGAIITTLSYFYLLKRKIKRSVDLSRNAEKQAFTPDRSDMKEIIPYREYKRRYTTRVREIAILSGTKGDSLEAIKDEFTDTMREYGSLIYHFTEYNAMGNPNKVQKLMEEIIQHDYDLVHTIGMSATEAAKHVTMNRNRLVPVVFSALRDSWWEKKNTDQKALHMTGVVGSGTWDIRIPLFIKAKPSMKSVLLIHSSYLQAEEIEQIIGYLEAKDINYQRLTPSSASDLIHSIQQYAHTVDSIITLRDGSTNQVADNLAKFCDQHSITFFSSNISNVNKGAAMAVSIKKVNMGGDTAHKAIAILEEHRNPSNIGLTHIAHTAQHEIRFNQEAMKRQGLDPKVIIDLAIDHGEVAYIPLDNASAIQNGGEH